MLHKRPKPYLRRLLIKGAATLFVAEAVAFVGCYGVWYKLNTDRDFRKSTSKSFPLVLDLYYKVGETLGTSNVRQIDHEYWSKQEH